VKRRRQRAPRGSAKKGEEKVAKKSKLQTGGIRGTWLGQTPAYNRIVELTDYKTLSIEAFKNRYCLVMSLGDESEKAIFKAAVKDLILKAIQEHCDDLKGTFLKDIDTRIPEEIFDEELK
jgi:hypothetical protein